MSGYLILKYTYSKIGCLGIGTAKRPICPLFWHKP